jgi:hypothetical protein
MQKPKVNFRLFGVPLKETKCDFEKVSLSNVLLTLEHTGLEVWLKW